PSLFFSLRTWVSGKGWFAVIVHSVWNGIFFAAGCATGEIECSLAGEDVNLNVIVIALSAGLLVAAYFLYRRKQKKSRFIV
ncbi:MAG: CAAX protease, partial [Nitrososphaera sp.]|nr:CAAX protease [Nitrososphaera sp.]